MSEGRRRRRRRKNRSSTLQRQATPEIAGEQVLDMPPVAQLPTAAQILFMESPVAPTLELFVLPEEEELGKEPAGTTGTAGPDGEAQPERGTRRRRRSRGGRRRTAEREAQYVEQEETVAEEVAPTRAEAPLAELKSISRNLRRDRHREESYPGIGGDSAATRAGDRQHGGIVGICRAGTGAADLVCRVHLPAERHAGTAEPASRSGDAG